MMNDKPQHHVFFTNADANRPSQICDSNGQVVLAQCRICGKAESELLDEPPCLTRGQINIALVNVSEMCGVDVARGIIQAAAGVRRMSHIPQERFADVMDQVVKAMGSWPNRSPDRVVQPAAPAPAPIEFDPGKQSVNLEDALQELAGATAAAPVSFDKAIDALTDIADMQERKPRMPISEDEALVMEAFDFGQFSRDMINGPHHAGLVEPVRLALVRMLEARYNVLYGPDAVPDDPNDGPSAREALIACLGDDAATLAAQNPDDEMAETMRQAAIMLERDAPVSVRPVGENMMTEGWDNGMNEVARAINYPSEWDTTTYPTLADALNEMCEAFKAENESIPKPPFSKSNVRYQKNTIYTIGVDANGAACVQSAKYSDNPQHDHHVMSSALELEEAVRLRSVVIEPHKVGRLWMMSASPLPYQIRESGEGEWFNATHVEYAHAQKNPHMDTRLNPAALQDWMRVMVFADMRERLALPYSDEASIGPYEVLDELNRIAHEANVVDKMKWIGKPTSARPEFSIEDLLSVADTLDSGFPRTEDVGECLLESATAFAARFVRSWLTTGVTLADRSADFETMGRLNITPGGDMPVSMPATCDDALRALDNGGVTVVRAFLEHLARKGEPEGVIANETDGYIIDGAMQMGFDHIDDNADLLVVHSNDLIKFTHAHREYALDNKLIYPAEFDTPLALILGYQCFELAHFAEQYRKNGVTILHKAEAEQAFMLDKMLRMWMMHGKDGWVDALNKDMGIKPKEEGTKS